MVVQTDTINYSSCIQTVIADGKPHEQIEMTLVATATVYPMRLVFPTNAALFDVCAADWGDGAAGAGQTEEVYLTEIPMDYPGRSMFDKTTVYPASSFGVPGFKLIEGRKYHVESTADLSALHEGNLLVIEAGGKLGVAVDAKTAPDTVAHTFSLVATVSTTEVVVIYKGMGYYDTA